MTYMMPLLCADCLRLGAYIAQGMASRMGTCSPARTGPTLFTCRPMVFDEEYAGADGLRVVLMGLCSS